MTASGFRNELRQITGSSNYDISFLIHLPVVCKTGGMFIVLLIFIPCRWCGLSFYICRRCWRGQAYCSDECRMAGYKKRHREAQRKYRQTQKGKKVHREAENRRRHGLSQKMQKNMDDGSSTVDTAWCMREAKAVMTDIYPLEIVPRCRFCGSYGLLVNRFPRRGYG